MSVLVRIAKQKAILRGAEWRCALVALEADLNRFTRDWVHSKARPEDLAGDLENSISDAVALHFHGKVLLRTSPRKELTKKRYFRLRQMDLFEF